MSIDSPSDFANIQRYYPIPQGEQGRVLSGVEHFRSLFEKQIQLHESEKPSITLLVVGIITAVAGVFLLLSFHRVLPACLTASTQPAFVGDIVSLGVLGLGSIVSIVQSVRLALHSKEKMHLYEQYVSVGKAHWMDEFIAALPTYLEKGEYLHLDFDGKRYRAKDASEEADTTEIQLDVIRTRIREND